MKKLLLLFLLFLLFSTSLFSKAHDYAEFDGLHWNSIYKGMFKTNISLSYDPEDDVVHMYFVDGIYTIALQIYPKGRARIINAVNKFKEWNQQAIEMKVELDKSIDTTSVKPYFYFGDEWNSGKNVIVNMSFFSQNVKRHQFLFNVGNIEHLSNEFVSFNPDVLYFDADVASEFGFLLSEEKLNSVKKDIQNKEDIESKFK